MFFYTQDSEFLGAFLIVLIIAGIAVIAYICR